jgi:uncharacterized membrane protein
MTVDQALQFIVSCGVVVPPQQLSRRGKLALVPPGKNGVLVGPGSSEALQQTEADAAPDP